MFHYITHNSLFIHYFTFIYKWQILFNLMFLSILSLAPALLDVAEITNKKTQSNSNQIFKVDLLPGVYSIASTVLRWASLAEGLNLWTKALPVSGATLAIPSSFNRVKWHKTWNQNSNISNTQFKFDSKLTFISILHENNYFTHVIKRKVADNVLQWMVQYCVLHYCPQQFVTRTFICNSNMYWSSPKRMHHTCQYWNLRDRNIGFKSPQIATK